MTKLKLPLLDSMVLLVLTDCYEALLDAEFSIVHLTQTHRLTKAGKVMKILEHIFKRARQKATKSQRIEVAVAHTFIRFSELQTRKIKLFGRKTT